MSTTSTLLVLLSLLLPSAVVTTVVRDEAREKTVTVTVEVSSDEDTPAPPASSIKSRAAVATVTRGPLTREPVASVVRARSFVLQDDSPPVDESVTISPVRKVVGKIVLTTPDGDVLEYELNDKNMSGGLTLPRLELDGNGKPILREWRLKNEEDAEEEELDYDIEPAELEELIKVNENGERLMVGVHCSPAEPLLRKHLQSGDVGLIVMEIVPDSPAQSAGIQKDDIMLKAGDVGLTHPIDLLKAVKAAGQNEMAVELIREGTKMTIQVTPRMVKQPEHTAVVTLNQDDPAETKAGSRAAAEGSESILELRGTNLDKGPYRLRQISPGIVIDKSAGSEEIEKLVQQAMKAARSATESQTQSEHALRKQIAELQEQLRMLSERLSHVESNKEK